jgi:uncharacterized protein with HEPN domain
MADLERVRWHLTGNLTSHEYHRLDIEIIENAIGIDLPKLITQIDQMLGAI